MEKLELRYLTKEDESAHADFIKEMLDSDGKMIPTAVEFDESDGSFSRWLERTNNEAKGDRRNSE